MSGILENAVGGLIAVEAHGMLALLLSRINEETKLLWDFSKELDHLKSKFTTLSHILENPSFQSNNKNQVILIQNWLNKVKNAAYDADDLLDECSYEALKQKNRTKNRDKLRDQVFAPFFRNRMSRKAKELSKLIDGFFKDSQELGMKPIKISACNYDNQDEMIEDAKQRDRRQWVDDQFLVGRDEDVLKLVELLCHPNNLNSDLTVVGIVGLAGLGKTALSKRVSKAHEVKDYFNSLVIWLVVSHGFIQTNILKKMAELLFGEASNLSESEALVIKLRGKLKGERYLLVLDDVWDNTFDWEPFKCALQDIGGSKGTTLLVTSREKSVVAKMDTYGYCENKDNERIITMKRAQIYELKGLNEDDSWSLFMSRMSCDKLLDVGDESIIPKRMIKKCGGVPLAIRALGDLLRGKKIKEWREIERSGLWEEKDKNGILPSLKLSFHYLPNTALKKCFSYCAIFEEDEVIAKDRLIQLWMAQGFLQPSHKMELIGEEYFHILLNCSLFQEAVLDEFGDVETIKIHDLVLSLARVVLREAEFSTSKGDMEVDNDHGSNEVRHFSSMLYEKEELSPTFCKLLRSYYYNPQSHYQQVYKSLNFLVHSKNLRVLCLCSLGLKDLPKSVGNLKHLRYLDISGNDFSTLPKVITKLYHLQTLRILSNGMLYGRKNFPILSKEVGTLINLRHICGGKYQEIGIPMCLGHLTALQTMPIINLREDWGGRLSELGSLQNLKGTLKIQGLECINNVDEARSLNLASKLNVDKLVLKWSSIREHSYKFNEILEALQPHENLATLDVKFYRGTRLPRWLMEMRGVGGSPLYNLVSLKLKALMYAEGDLHIENLKCLRFLSIKHCYSMTISFPKHGFQCCKDLEVLMIDECNLENVPDLSPLTQLRVLEITSCRGKRRTKLELVGLSSLPWLRALRTDELLPKDLANDSPICRSLQVLDLAKYDTQTLPKQLQHFVALQCLEISEFDCLERLPDWLGKLTSLRRLSLVSMPKLKWLPSEDAMQCMSSLQDLWVDRCPLLEKQFSKKNGMLFKIVGHLDISWLNTQRRVLSAEGLHVQDELGNFEQNMRLSI